MLFIFFPADINIPHYFFFSSLDSQRWVQRPCNNNVFLLFSFSCCLLHLVPWHFSPDEVHEPGMWHDFQILILALMCAQSIYVYACEWDVGREETRSTNTINKLSLIVCPPLNALHLTATSILCWLFSLHPQASPGACAARSSFNHCFFCFPSCIPSLYNPLHSKAFTYVFFFLYLLLPIIACFHHDPSWRSPWRRYVNLDQGNAFFIFSCRQWKQHLKIF